jgi:hypothetical protein
MRMSYKFLVLSLLSMLMFGCGNDQDKTVINYCKAIDAGKLDEAVAYLSKDAKEALDSTGGKALLAEVGSRFKQHKGIDSIKITNKKVAGEKADVLFTYNFKDGSKFDDFFPLVKEEGKWKISK